jgi:hypothetical protein
MDRWDVIHNTLRFIYAVNPSAYESGKMSDPTPLGFSSALNLSAWESAKMSNPTPLGSDTCRAQMLVSLTWCQTQHSWTQIHAEPKCLRVLQDTSPHTLGFNYMLCLRAYGSGKILDPASLVLELIRVRIHQELKVFIGVIPGHKAML